MHDPFQSYATMSTPYGAGAFNPIGINPAMQNFINPQQLQLASALAQQAGIPQLLGQQLFGHQLGSQFGQLPFGQQQPFGQSQLGQAWSGISPFATGLHNPIAAALHNPITAALLTNPVVAAALQSQYAPYGGQQFGLPQSLYPQVSQGGPFGQPGIQGLTPQLAPQSWVGPLGQGIGQAYGQINPILAQLGARTFQGQGISPWGY